MSTDPREGAAARRWRTGRKVGRTIYAVLGDTPSDTDPLIGVMDTPELAAAAVEGHNESGDDHDTLVRVLVQHQRISSSHCGCGWSVLGASFPEHQATEYEKAMSER